MKLIVPASGFSARLGSALVAGAMSFGVSAQSTAQSQSTAPSTVPPQISAVATPQTQAQDVSADVFVKNFSDEALQEIKTRKKELLADPAKLDALVDEKVMPNVNFQKMTQLVVGRPWRTATPEQREQIVEQFRNLLVKTYSGALSQVNDQTLQVDPVRARPDATNVIVNSRIVQKEGPPIALAYRVEKQQDGWKVYDLSVLGLWLVDSYKAQFQPVLSSSGVEGLITALKAKNG